jgi:hypothetical protein
MKNSVGQQPIARLWISMVYFPNLRQMPFSFLFQGMEKQFLLRKNILMFNFS